MWQVLWSYGENSIGESFTSAVIILRLRAGQQVWVEPNSIDSMYGADYNGMYSWFSGHLLYAV